MRLPLLACAAVLCASVDAQLRGANESRPIPHAFLVEFTPQAPSTLGVAILPIVNSATYGSPLVQGTAVTVPTTHNTACAVYSGLYLVSWAVGVAAATDASVYVTVTGSLQTYASQGITYASPVESTVWTGSMGVPLEASS